MATFLKAGSPRYYDGVTPAIDQDGQLVLDPDLVDRPSLFSLRIVPSNKFLSHTVRYYNGVTAGKDQDGVLVVDEDFGYRLSASEMFRLAGPPKRLTGSVSYYDGVTISKDHDGQLVYDSELTNRTSSFVLQRKLRSSATISGTSTASVSARLRLEASANVQGQASASAAALNKKVYPGSAKSYFSGNPTLRDLGEAAFSGDPSVDNFLNVNSLTSLVIAPAYSGAAYQFNGPADTGSSPVKLGFKTGDRIRLRGPLGTEANHGKELTINDPAALTVFEELATPDATDYEFDVFRRLP